jgi:hypothetical protein
MQPIRPHSRTTVPRLARYAPDPSPGDAGTGCSLVTDHHYSFSARRPTVAAGERKEFVIMHMHRYRKTH